MCGFDNNQAHTHIVDMPSLPSKPCREPEASIGTSEHSASSVETPPPAFLTFFPVKKSNIGTRSICSMSTMKVGNGNLNLRSTFSKETGMGNIRSIRSPSAKAKESVGRDVLHQIFNSRNKLSSMIGLCALLSVTLCLPVLLVSNFNMNQNLRQMKTSMSSLTMSVASIPSASVGMLSHFGRTLIDEEGTDNQEMEEAEDDNPNIVPHAPQATAVQMPAPLPPYSLENVIATAPHYHDTFSVLVYDPASDKFVSHYSKNMRWISACHKLINSIKIVANSLRILFPDRFNSNAPEFAMAISSADFPGVKWNDCLHQQREDCFDNLQVGLAPIMHFGSVFRRDIFPTMMAMPMPQSNQLSCFHYWAEHEVICNFLLPRSPSNTAGLVFPEHIGLNWDELIPQVVWRGTDFSYLHKMEPNLRSPNFDMDVASQIDLSERVDKKLEATRAMRAVYDELIPRWKGVVWTAEAERAAESTDQRNLNRKRRTNRAAKQAILVNKKRVMKEQEKMHERRQQQMQDNEPVGPALPWANIKFASAMHMGQKTPTGQVEFYQQFDEFGIPAVGEGMSLEELGRFRYHVDLGGGGGTTWSGTLEKLGLPGLLFHHVTPTKDYLHDKIKPWVHYVPIKADLSDLKDKFEWAESHPLMAQRISAQATEVTRSFGTPEGMDAMFKQFFEYPLRQVVEAYQPLEQGPGAWREAMAAMSGDELRPIMQCMGYHHHDCERLVDDIEFTHLHIK